MDSPDEVITPPELRLTLDDPSVHLEFSHDVKFAGTLEDCNRALSALFYRGDSNWNSANKNKDVVTFTVTELLTGGGGVPTTDVRTMFVEVVSVNDAPVVHVPEPHKAHREFNEDNIDHVVVNVTGLVGDEDTPLYIPSVSVSDVDLEDDSMGLVRITLSADHGTLSMSFHTNTTSINVNERNSMDDDLSGLRFDVGSAAGRGESYVQFVTTMAEANVALSLLYYTGNNDWYGQDGVTVTVSDMGYTGLGGPKFDTQTIPVTIRPVNDAPELHVFRLPDGTNTVCPRGLYEPPPTHTHTHAHTHTPGVCLGWCWD